ncbi:uncharacterized protein LOC124116670 [Haliotis rufescens]|uniref:uncharacterized protein LOC124116670 n=1 Tax=Haliotis rufescens TaxID=6454 RepID=UPI001EAFC80F|nr:uncharacterized protein LOC124116670 [Haliotis rufescens]
MLLLVAGLITFSCLRLSVLGADDDRDALLYKVDIFLPPKEGRDEKADIRKIQETLNSITDIRVLFAFKELGNPRIILVLDVEKKNSWHQLTGFLSRKGYEFSVTALYSCEGFAQDLGVNLTRDMFATSFGDDDLIMDRKIFPEKDLTTLEYNEKLKWTFERNAEFVKAGMQGTCFKTLAAYPVELVYFVTVNPHTIEVIEEGLHGPNHFQNQVTRIENLDSYTGVC